MDSYFGKGVPTKLAPGLYEDQVVVGKHSYKIPSFKDKDGNIISVYKVKDLTYEKNVEFAIKDQNVIEYKPPYQKKAEVSIDINAPKLKSYGNGQAYNTSEEPISSNTNIVEEEEEQLVDSKELKIVLKEPKQM
jgi:hypothetical protein